MTAFVMLCADTARSRAYLDALGRAALLPSRLLLLEGSGPGKSNAACTLFDNVTPVAVRAESAGIPVERLPTADVNAPATIEALARLGEDLVVFSGPGGAILRPPLFATGKRFLHVHPGRLPAYRGSTTIYYSMLAESKIEATAILLTPGIDEGAIVTSRAFPVPADRRTIDVEYDPWVRACVMADAVRQLVESGRMDGSPQEEANAETYYIIHPVLKHIAILSDR